MSVGTEIKYGNSMVPDHETEQRPHEVSFSVDKSKAQEVTKDISHVGCQDNLQWRHGFGYFTQGVGKGQALASLLKKGNSLLILLLAASLGTMLSCLAFHMFLTLWRNAQEELLEWHAENAQLFQKKPMKFDFVIIKLELVTNQKFPADHVMIFIGIES
ncbi:unnamed protein product [Arabis nemorensis]|uniref:Sucrose phosphatase-like domain-containing protein n=1 Tax=Arabis nemorensis TaxID=586526 RepID=A0A565BI57_9BRAS|nr:unnamed protein product [Arabis nemorensis]